MNLIKHFLHINNTSIGSKQRAYGIDTSRYEYDFNPDNATIDIDFGITKATEGTTWIDPYFDTLYTQINKLAINGAYHYLRSNLDGITQAKFFLNVIKDKKLDILAIDFERIGNVINDAFVKVLYDCISYVTNARPDCKVILYTNPDLYDTIIYPASVRLWGRDVFTSWDLWIAQYYYIVNPDGEPYIKNRKDWKLWQFSDKGDPASHGTTSYIDRDVFNGTKEEMLQWVNKGTITFPYSGVIQEQGILNDQKYYLQTIDPNNKSIVVRHFAGELNTVESVAKLDNATIAINGDDYVKGGAYMPRGMSYVNGKQYTPPFEGRYWLNISNSGKISYGYGQPPLNAYNLTSFVRPLVVNGALHAGLSDLTNPANKEIHARSILGINAQGQLMILICEGFVNPTTGIAYAGVTLPQAAQLMLNKGAQFAGEHGGGGDSQLYSLGTMVNESSDRDTGSGWRGVVQALEIFIGENSMTEKYDVISTKYNMTLRPEHNTGAIGTESITAGTHMFADELWIATQDLYKVINGINTKINSVGDKWAHIVRVGTTIKNAWTAIIHNGVEYCTYTDIAIPTHPSTSPVVFTSQSIDFSTKTMTIVRKREDGTIDTLTDPIA